MPRNTTCLKRSSNGTLFIAVLSGNLSGWNLRASRDIFLNFSRRMLIIKALLQGHHLRRQWCWLWCIVSVRCIWACGSLGQAVPTPSSFWISFEIRRIRSEVPDEQFIWVLIRRNVWFTVPVGWFVRKSERLIPSERLSKEQHSASALAC